MVISERINTTSGTLPFPFIPLKVCMLQANYSEISLNRKCLLFLSLAPASEDEEASQKRPCNTAGILGNQ